METMKKFCISLITLLFISFATSDECITCVQREKCEEFGNLNQLEQKEWELKYPCPNGLEHDEEFGSNAADTGDYVCCPSAPEAFQYRWYPKTNSPRRPETGTCGQVANKADRFAVPPRFSRFESFSGSRVQRSAEVDDVSEKPVKRIIGGSETEFEDYPWTVFVRKIATDFYGNQNEFHCGGALISSQYVLTAGHCVYDSEGGSVKMYVVLAEHDKRTFPTDCQIYLGQGNKCMDNVMMNTEEVILHPEYNHSFLRNDIALLKLRGKAPYTNYIRPICLPSINVDSSDYMNLPLGVAGWGDNGPYSSDIKQSTVVHLVPHRICQNAYPYLSRGHMCAVGYSGEDSCRGDSGGPLVRVNGGKYEVVGVVSGKREDTRCGSDATVPSLYTNVYHYLAWIHSNIQN